MLSGHQSWAVSAIRLDLSTTRVTASILMSEASRVRWFRLSVMAVMKSRRNWPRPNHWRMAQDLARHSDINLTMGTYAHTVLQDQSRALDALPNLLALPTEELMRVTGTDGDFVYGLSKGTQSQFDRLQPDQNGRSKGAERVGLEVEKAR